MPFMSRQLSSHKASASPQKEGLSRQGELRLPKNDIILHKPTDLWVHLKKAGNISFLFRYIYIGSRKGVDVMRNRINYKALYKKKPFVEANFWDEFNKRGFKVEPKNDGTFYQAEQLRPVVNSRYTIMELFLDNTTKFNIVTPENFMKTVAQIEGLVKYKLFK
jgi:hypothetical protein